MQRPSAHFVEHEVFEVSESYRSSSKNPLPWRPATGLAAPASALTRSAIVTASTATTPAPAPFAASGGNDRTLVFLLDPVDGHLCSGLQRRLSDDITMADPHFYADRTINRIRGAPCKINIGAKRMERNASFLILLRTSDFRSAQTSAAHNTEHPRHRPASRPKWRPSWLRRNEIRPSSCCAI